MREKEGKRDEEFMHAHTCLKCYGQRCRAICLKKNISICMVHQIFIRWGITCWPNIILEEKSYFLRQVATLLTLKSVIFL